MAELEIEKGSFSQEAKIPTERDFNQWRSSGEYLPDFMRDFHDQKDLFKALHDVVDRSLARDKSRLYMRDLTWTDAHVYTVDIFLWIMAGHGYTLQRSRRKFAFGDIGAFVARANEAARAAMSEVLKQAFASPSLGTKSQSDGVDQ